MSETFVGGSERGQLFAALGQVGSQYRYVQRCLPCPQGIQIPEMLKETHGLLQPAQQI